MRRATSFLRHASCHTLALFAVAGIAMAQAVDRYELGLRLRAFERRLATVDEAPKRAAAYAELDRAVQAFFRLDTTTVAKAIAAADAALAGEPTPAQRFAISLRLELPARLADPSKGAVAVQLARAFPCDDELPAGLELAIRLDGDAKDRLRLPVTELPLDAAIDVSDASLGDRTLQWRLQYGETALTTRTQGLSLAADLGRRLPAIEAAAGDRDRQPTSLEAGTLDLLAQLCAGMTRSNREETVLPGAQLLAEAEVVAKAVAAGAARYDTAAAGQFWLRVPTGRSSTVVRLQAPPIAKDDAKKRPLVLALHGAGGSENLFFDGYGDGAIAPLCAARGWFLVAPRLGLMGGGADLPALVDALAARWPIDVERVLVVGHSMGAGAAMAAAGRTPSRFRAVAALGGGGAVPKAAAAKELPFFVGVGERDFARAGALRLHEGMLAGGIPSTLREYAAVEHLAIVQIALPDVFAFFEGALAAK
jgi:pimeloyl-ACP methyl ester carboxylesterase